MKKLLFIFSFVFIIFAKSCQINNYDFIESGDFMYEIVTPKNDEVDREPFVRIMGLSETGKEKEVIIVPQFIDGMEVKEIGRKLYLTIEGDWESEKLKKVYIPFLPCKMWRVVYPDDCPNYETTLLIVNEIPYENSTNVDVYITSYHYIVESAIGDSVPSDFRSGTPGCYFANVSYFYNYDEAPNCGYYWIDNYDYGNIISYIPENPIREGYIFDGWYKESECINKWDFENDKLPIKICDENNRTIYQETRLYAKWIKEE